MTDTHAIRIARNAANRITALTQRNDALEAYKLEIERDIAEARKENEALTKALDEAREALIETKARLVQLPKSSAARIAFAHPERLIDAALTTKLTKGEG